MHTDNKKYYVDIKETEDDQRKYVKISELSNNRRATVRFQEEDVRNIIETLKKVEDRSTTSIKSRSSQTSHYEVTAMENERGNAVEVSENHFDGRKHRVFINEEIIDEIVEAIDKLSKRHLKTY